MTKSLFKITLLFAVTAMFSCTRYHSNIQTVLPQKGTVIPDDNGRHLKRKVAIARFSNESDYNKGFFSDPNAPDIGKQALDILSSKLASTGKFILLERSDTDAINKELSMKNMGSLKLPADQLIIGSITGFGRSTTGDVGVFTRSKRQTASATVHVRLVDVNTGEELYGEDGSGEAYSEVGSVMGVGGRSGYDSQINDNAIDAAISQLVDNLISKLLDMPWKSYILDYQNGYYIISGGKSQGINAGDAFDVMRKGKTIINPQTGMPLTLPASLLGTIKVISTAGDTPADEVATCEKTSGDIPTQAFDDIFIKEIK